MADNDLSDDLLPGEDEGLRTDREAAAKLDQVQAPPATVTKLRRKGPKPPLNLAEPMIEFGCHMRVVSIGKAIANVSATLNFEMDIPQEGIGELMGEHAYAGVFVGFGFLGEGLFIKQAPLAVDVENRLHQKLQVTLPRFDSANTDQMVRSILPLIGDPKLLTPLLDLEGPWRLNCQVDIPGTLRFHAMQQSFDLTAKAPEHLSEVKAE
jgi:hypothetical protein